MKKLLFISMLFLTNHVFAAKGQPQDNTPNSFIIPAQKTTTQEIVATQAQQITNIQVQITAQQSKNQLTFNPSTSTLVQKRNQKKH